MDATKQHFASWSIARKAPTRLAAPASSDDRTRVCGTVLVGAVGQLDNLLYPADTAHYPDTLSVMRQHRTKSTCVHKVLRSQRCARNLTFQHRNDCWPLQGWRFCIFHYLLYQALGNAVKSATSRCRKQSLLAHRMWMIEKTN